MQSSLHKAVGLASLASLGMHRLPFASVRCAASAAPAPLAPPKYTLLEYKYVPDIIEKRGPHRAEHLAGAKKQAEAGKLVMAGAFGDTPDGALFIWAPNATHEEIKAFVQADPYVKNGLVPSWAIKPYAVVVEPK